MATAARHGPSGISGEGTSDKRNAEFGGPGPLILEDDNSGLSEETLGRVRTSVPAALRGARSAGQQQQPAVPGPGGARHQAGQPPAAASDPGPSLARRPDEAAARHTSGPAFSDPAFPAPAPASAALPTTPDTHVATFNQLPPAASCPKLALSQPKGKPSRTGFHTPPCPQWHVSTPGQIPLKGCLWPLRLGSRQAQSRPELPSPHV